MKNDAALAWLTGAIEQATTAMSTFQTSGQLPAVDRLAPYGQGTRTLVDPKVRNTLELDPSRFQLGDDWQQMIAWWWPCVRSMVRIRC